MNAEAHAKKHAMRINSPKWAGLLCRTFTSIALTASVADFPADLLKKANTGSISNKPFDSKSLELFKERLNPYLAEKKFEATKPSIVARLWQG